MTFRTLLRVGATSLLATGALVAAGLPAHAAATTDFGVALKGTTIAAGADGKFGTLTLTNEGTTMPAEVGLVFDVTGLDTGKVELDLGDCTFTDGIAECVIDTEFIPKPGGSSDLTIPMRKVEGATGSVGELSVTVVVEGDENGANDSAAAAVEVGGSGVDMAILAEDVTLLDSEGEPSGTPVPPGGESAVTGG